jgi:hypothetical protein
MVLFLFAVQSMYDPTADSLYRWYLRATIIGVGGGLTGLGILMWQSFLLRRSADAAKKAAEIAEQSLTVLQHADILVDQVSFVSRYPDDAGYSALKIIFKNFGNTEPTTFA